MRIERRERRVQPHVDAVCAVQVEQEIGHRAGHRARAKPRRAFDDERVDAELARGRRHFEPDPAAADHEHAAARAQLLAERERLVERAQVVKMSGPDDRIRQASRRAARRDHEPVVLDLAARRGAHDAPRAIDRRRALRLPRVDVERAERVGLHDAHGRDVGLAREYRLRQRRPLVRQMRFVRDHHDAPGEALVAQRLHDPARRLAAADHDDGARHGRRIGTRVLSHRRAPS